MLQRADGGGDVGSGADGRGVGEEGSRAVCRAVVRAMGVIVGEEMVVAAVVAMIGVVFSVSLVIIIWQSSGKW